MMKYCIVSFVGVEEKKKKKKGKEILRREKKKRLTYLTGILSKRLYVSYKLRFEA